MDDVLKVRATLNKAAKRQVVQSSPFVGLLQAGNCTVELESNGDTLHSVNSIKDAAYHYQTQTKALAQALAGGSLEETVSNNYAYLYTHYQYEIDGMLQRLRSPRCAFAQRFVGIDCKSFSLLASTLLLNQNIVHYIRRIKQNSQKLQGWSHVYIVIPFDQNTRTESLDNQNYYVIDGTKHINWESNFIEKHDTLMLPHVWLNGDTEQESNPIKSYERFLALLLSNNVAYPVVLKTQQTINSYINKGVFPVVNLSDGHIIVQDQRIPLTGGLNYGLGIDLDLNGLLDNLSFGSIFQSLSCIGGTYDKKDAEKTRDLVTAYFTQAFTTWNQLLTQGKTATNLFALNNLANKILYDAGAYAQYTNKAAAHNWSSSCSKKATAAIKVVGEHFEKVAETVFLGYLSQYFTFTPGTRTVAANSFSFETRSGSTGMKKDGNNGNTDVKTISNLAFKSNVNVPFFEMPVAASNAIANNTFDLGGFLAGLVNVAVQGVTGGNNNNNNNNPDLNNPDTNNPNNPGNGNDEPQKAGFGIVEGAITAAVLFGAYKMVSSASDEKPKNAPKTTTSTKTKRLQNA